MVDFLEMWIIVAFLGVTLAAPLGPINLEIIKQALNKAHNTKLAWLAAAITGIGAMTGDILVATIALTVGGEILLDVFSNPAIRLVLFTFNIFFLGFLGFSALRAKSYSYEERGDISDSSNNKLLSGGRLLIKQYITGFSIVITSPWTFFWWVGVGTIILFSDISMAAPDLLSRLVIVFMFMSGILLWDLFFSSSLIIARRVPNPTLLLWITRGTAIILIGFAALMIDPAYQAFIEIIAG
ncbi:MAG: LysE family translocator [Candidatus Hodarchaeales archaeon]|jgi:threonine/homoserine/homoserine lactone efflux protein